MNPTLHHQDIRATLHALNQLHVAHHGDYYDRHERTA